VYSPTGVTEEEVLPASSLSHNLGSTVTRGMNCAKCDNSNKIMDSTDSDVLAQLGPKAVALAWPEPALAFSRAGPSQSRHSWLGPGPAWPKPQLLAHILIKFLHQIVGAAEDMVGGEGGQRLIVHIV
jgi:hypothetical protein